jgi:hypothetical protein
MAREEHTPAVKPRRTHPVEALRGFARSLGGAATQGAASAAVRGAADGLREQMPDRDGQLQALAQDGLALAARLVHEAALREQAAPGTFAHDTAAAAMRGLLGELEAAAKHGGLPLHGLLLRLSHLLDQLDGFAASRQREMVAPGARARSMAEGVVDGAMDRLHEGMPTVAEDLQVLVPAAGSIAYAVGHELLRGLEARAREGSDEGSEALTQAMERAGEGLVHGVSRGLAAELPALGARLRRPAAWLAAGGALLVLARVIGGRRS